MNKKLLSLLLAGMLILSTACTASGAELEESGAVLTIDRITHYSNPQDPIIFNITVPTTYTDGILLAGFYTNGQMSKLEPLDISSKSKFSVKYQMTYEDNDGYPLTPDEIKLFIWNRGNLMPLTIATESESILTSDIIEAANYCTINWMLNRILGTGSTTGVISALKSKIDPPENYPKIIYLLDLMKDAAQKAYNIKSEKILTSEFTKRFLDDELQELKSVVEYIESVETQKNALVNAYNTLNKTQKNTINYLFTFFGIEFNLQ
ncbi:MAG: hypothetical protein J6D26_08990 [Clostridia bacterium]|nr:hypothetical protein [Clostridia bacterium]